jgi:uncharacterized protein YceK
MSTRAMIQCQFNDIYDAESLMNISHKTLQIFLVFFAGILSISGCSTFLTLSSKDGHIKNTLRNKATNCRYVTRVFSGCAYSYCTLDSRPNEYGSELNTLLGLGDLGGSCLADIFALPYTAYKQNKYGSIKVK